MVWKIFKEWHPILLILAIIISLGGTMTDHIPSVGGFIGRFIVCYPLFFGIYKWIEYSKKTKEKNSKH